MVANHNVESCYLSKRAIDGAVRRKLNGQSRGLRVHEWDEPCSTINTEVMRDGSQFIHPNGKVVLKQYDT